MARLAKPAKEASDAMNTYLGGWSAFNSDGTMKSSLQIQKELHDGFSKLSEQEQMAAASAIFGKNQMAPWLALINTAPKDVNKLSNELTNCKDVTDEMAKAMMDGAGGSVEKLKSSLDVLGTKFGEIISTALIPMADNVQKIVDWFLSLDSGTQQLIGTFAMIIAIIGPLAITIGLVGGAIGNLITIFTAIPAAALPVIAIIAAVVAAFIYLWNTNEGFRTRVMEIWTELSAAFSQFFAQAVEFLNGIGINAENLKVVWDTVWEFISRCLIVAFDLIKGVIEFGLDYIMGIFHIFHGSLTGDWDEMWAGIKQILSGAWDLLKSIFEAGCDNLGINAGELKEKIKEKFTEMKEDAVDKVTELKEKAIEIWENLKESVQEKVGDIKDKVVEGFDNAIEYITDLPGQAYDWGADIIESIADGIWGAIDSVIDAAASVADTIWSYLHFSEPEVGPLADFHTWMPDMMGGLAEGMKRNMPTLRAGVDLVANEMSGIIPGTGTAGRYDGGDGGSRTTNLGGVSIVVNGAEGQDEEAVADAVMRRMMELVASEV
jgi:phage-related protein